MAEFERIGRFEVQSELGRGGFARVYRAYDPTISRPVAIKVLTQGDGTQLKRFRDEARAAGNMRHENIVTIFESGEEHGLPFIVMELLEGEDLSQVLASRKLSLLESMDIMAQVARGLHYAHQASVFHRDVKPANIRILPDGKAKIMDFGIARFTHSNNTIRTRQGDLLGTLLYMAPEQLTGQEFDARGDVFAYGVMYYQLIAGDHPFSADDPSVLMCNITMNDPKPLRQMNPECPEALERILTRALQKDRDMRYQSFDDLLFDTDPILVELKKTRAARILEDTERLFECGEFDPAQASLRQVLDLDPSNVRARKLRESVQKELQQQSMRSRIDSVVRIAEEHIAGRRFSAALEALEAAVRLDTEDGRLRPLLESARLALERARRSDALLSQARRDLEAKKVEEALQHATEAVEADATYTDAADLLETVHTEIAKRQFQDSISKARGLILMKSYDAALSLLEGLEREQPGQPQVAELLARAWQQQREAARERDSEMRTMMAQAYELRQTGRTAEALALLEAFQQQHGENATMSGVAEQLRDEVNNVPPPPPAEALAAGRKRVRQLLEAKRFDEAILAIDAIWAKFPSAGELDRDRHEVLLAKERHRARNVLDRVRREWPGKGSPSAAARKKLGEALADVKRVFPEGLRDEDVSSAIAWAEAVKPADSPFEEKRVASETWEKAKDPALTGRPEMTPPRRRTWFFLVTGAAVASVAVWFGTRQEGAMPILTIQPYVLSFTAQAGEPDPPSQMVSVGSTGSNRPYTATPSERWITVSPAAGNTPAELAVLVSATGLPAGSYGGTITFGPSQAPRLVQVKLVVRAVP